MQAVPGCTVKLLQCNIFLNNQNVRFYPSWSGSNSPDTLPGLPVLGCGWGCEQRGSQGKLCERVTATLTAGQFFKWTLLAASPFCVHGQRATVAVRWVGGTIGSAPRGTFPLNKQLRTMSAFCPPWHRFIPLRKLDEAWKISRAESTRAKLHDSEATSEKLKQKLKISAHQHKISYNFSSIIIKKFSL